MIIDVECLERAVQELRDTLKDGLMATDIWDPTVGLSITGYNSQAAAVALFTQMTNSLVEALTESGFPKLNRYYILDLEADHMVVILRHHNGLLQGMLLNTKKTNMGMLIAVAIPKMLASVGE